MSSPYPQRLTGFARRFLVRRQSGHYPVVGAPAARRAARGILDGLPSPGFRCLRAGSDYGCRLLALWRPCARDPRGAGECLPRVSPLGCRAACPRAAKEFSNKPPFCPGTEKTPAGASVFSLQRVKKISVTVVTFLNSLFRTPSSGVIGQGDAAASVRSHWRGRRNARPSGAVVSQQKF